MDLSPLNTLLVVGSKEAIEQSVLFVFLTRHAPFDNASSPIVQRFIEILALNEAKSEREIVQLRYSILQCIEAAVSAGDVEALVPLFEENGSTVNPKLKKLIAQIIANNFENWRDSAAIARISLPKLIDFDWALHFQRATSELSAMQIPTVLVSLKVENTPSQALQMPETTQIQFELSREALATTIDGLGKIRDQLASMN